MKTSGYSVFQTAIGACGFAWGPVGIIGVQLPEGSLAKTQARLRRRFPDIENVEPSGEMRRARKMMIELLEGRSRDLTGITLDMRSITLFRRGVYEVARKIPCGETRTYKEVAVDLGKPQSARAVGQALGSNPFPIIVPCHRVLAAGGKIGGFSAEGGVTTKTRILEIEGVALSRAPIACAAGYSFEPGEAIDYLRRTDSRLSQVIDTVGAFDLQLKATSSVFAALAEAIVYQQLSGKAAETIFQRVCALMPQRRRSLNATNLLDINEKRLRDAGLSSNKIRTLRDLAERSLSGEIPTLAKLRRMSDDEVVEALTVVCGIGRWTAQMFLIFRLGRSDVLAADDLGLRQGHAAMMGRRKLSDPRTLAARGEQWRPYRSVASWYLWRYAERTRGA